MGDRGPDSLWVKEFNAYEEPFYLLTPMDLQLKHQRPSLGSALVRGHPCVRPCLLTPPPLSPSLSLLVRAGSSLAHGLCKSQRVCACVCTATTVICLMGFVIPKTDEGRA